MESWQGGGGVGYNEIPELVVALLIGDQASAQDKL